MMKKAAVTGPTQATIIDAPLPEIPANGVLVKVEVAPMCAEYKGFVAGNKNDCLGHEAVGEVVESSSPQFQKGDRVVVMPLSSCGTCEYCLSGDYIYCEENPMNDATMAQYVAKPAHQVRHIPDDITYEKASLACCALGPSFGAFQSLRANAYSTILITGLGPVGLGAVVNAKFLGARVIAVDTNEHRTKIAKEMGADLILDPTDPEIIAKIKEFCHGSGPDGAVDCSGAKPAHRLCIDAVRRKGWVAFVGESFAETPIVVSNDLIRKGLHLVGSWHYNMNDFPKIMEVIRRSPVVDHLITNVFPMSQIQEAFETSASQSGAKILLKPWE